MEGRGQLSFWDRLPEWGDEARMWAYQQLAERNLTQVEILDGVNERLRAAAWEEGLTTDIPQASKSSLNRLSMRRAKATRRMADARAMWDGMATQFDHNSPDKSAVVLGEFLKTLVLELAETDGHDTRGAMELARAYQAIINGMRSSSEHRRKLQEEFASKTAQAIDHVVKEGGLSAERAAEIRRAVLGVRDRPLIAPPTDGKEE